jgi:hypothetical protein
MEGLQTQAAVNRGATLSAGEARRAYDEAIRRGYTPVTAADDQWVGGLHVNLLGPSGEKLHFPLPEGFVP